MKDKCRPCIVACDVNGTLTGIAKNDYELSQRLLGEFGRRISHHKAVGGQKLFFGTATGLSAQDHIELETQNKLFGAVVSEADFKITSVGAAIAYRQSGRFVIDQRWPQLDNWCRERAMEAVAHRRELQLQDKAVQSPHKISFNVGGVAQGSHSEYVTELKKCLKRHNVHAEIVFSAGYFLDILPEGINKGMALRQVVTALTADSAGGGIPVLPPFILGAGDSMNDCDLLLAANAAVLPSNADSTLRQWARQTIPDKLYQAKAPFAGGVLEGMEYFGVIG
jgi:sucrose-6F-phosphate phosphohydrolase